MTHLYTAGAAIYKGLGVTTGSSNRKQKVAAIRRTIPKLENCESNNTIQSIPRESLPALQRLIVTHTGITCLSNEDIRILKDLEDYLNGVVGD